MSEDASENEEVARNLLKGGSSGLAALIRTTQQRSRGLGELSVPKDVRMERSMSTQEGSTDDHSVPNPIRKPPRVARLSSVPNDMNRSNGDIQRKVPLLPPSLPTTGTGDIPPPKPPRTGSTSPSVFMSLERGRELEGGVDYHDLDEEEEEEEECWSEEEIPDDEYHEERVISMDHSSLPSKRPLLPPSSRKPGYTPSDTSTPGNTSGSTPGNTPSNTPSASPAETKGGPGSSPKVPLLPPTKSPSRTPPTPPKVTPTSLKESSPRPKPHPPARPFICGCDEGDNSKVDDDDDDDDHLKRENELLKQQILMLQQKLGQNSQTQSSTNAPEPVLVPFQEPEVPGSLTEDKEIPFSPCEDDEKERDKFPSDVSRQAKPVPLPRAQAQTVANPVSNPPRVSPQSSVPTTVGFIPQESTETKKKIASKPIPPAVSGSDSPVPKPRSQSKVVTTPVKTLSGSGVVGEASSHVTSSSAPRTAGQPGGNSSSCGGGDGVGTSTPPSYSKEDKTFRSDSSSSDKDKAKAVLTLQKLIPVSSGPRKPSLPEDSVSSSKQGEEKEVGSHPVPAGSASFSSIQSPPTSKPIVVPRSSSDVSSAMCSAPKTAREGLANPKPDLVVVAPLSSSIPPPSLLGSKEPKRTSVYVKAPLNSVAHPVPSESGRSKYKKMTISDDSWIKRKASLSDEIKKEESCSTSNELTSSNQPEQPVAKPPYPPRSDPSTTSPGNRGDVGGGKTSDAGGVGRSSTTSDSGVGRSSTTSDSGVGRGSNTSVAKGPPPPRPLPFRNHPILHGTKPVLQSFIPPPLTTSTPPSVPRIVTPEPPRKTQARERTGTVSTDGSVPKKKFWGKTPSDGSGGKKPHRRHSFTKSTSNEDIAPLASEVSGKERKWGKKSKSNSNVLDLSVDKGRPHLTAYGKKNSDVRPVSMLVVEKEKERKAELTSSMTTSMLRGVQADEILKRKQKKGFLGLFKSRTTVEKHEASPLEEINDGSDSGSDDEKGGTIKKMPKLRHVSIKRQEAEDDSEPEYHQLFEYVFVVGLKEDRKGKLTTEMTYTFPPTSREFSGKDLALKSIPQFCFPDIDQWKPTKVYQSESFSFVLTDMEANRRYGYCRRLLPEGSGPRLPEVFCIVSPLGCFSLYENILDHVEERRAISSLSVFNFLKAISANPFPRPGRSVEVKVFGARGSGMETLTFNRPMDSRLEHVNFSLLFSTLSQRKIIQLFSSLLMERRVVFCAQSLSLTTGCAHALMALLYPFEWQHVFIPVLPSSLIDFVCSPLPYIIGINPSSYKHFDDMEMDEAVVINLDKGKFLRKIGDEKSILPSKLFQFLEGKLGSSIINSDYRSPSRKDHGPSKADEIVVNTFMTFFAYLYGDYRKEMKVTKTGYKEFQRTEYVKRFSSKSTRRFLEAFHMTQMFENFIEHRENPNKAETLAASLFEKKLPELKERCQDIELFSSKSRFDRWKMKKDLAKGEY